MTDKSQTTLDEHFKTVKQTLLDFTSMHPGCGEDQKWNKRKDALIAEAKEYVERN